LDLQNHQTRLANLAPPVDAAAGIQLVRSLAPLILALQYVVSVAGLLLAFLSRTTLGTKVLLFILGLILQGRQVHQAADIQEYSPMARPLCATALAKIRSKSLALGPEK
jgi:hypothetical protein